ncbi:DUF262 domain-containing protein [Marinomonas sp. FW-1]|uniref:DUF262 domain-containing protein n=1 Tax=Marinomonas sp. FW-1 TaxID=2071621 RepID=UPI0010C04320|nr:DUF262 domain-containing protein [Marinomonas sp. FW-1]
MSNKSLLAEVSSARKDIKADSYNMSVGELINLYKDGEIFLEPAYQRLFRWDNEQKSNFIESLILGIPIPPIFVSQRSSGMWDVVDGVQRLSTILQLAGELEKLPPLKLDSTKYIPSLEGKTWKTLPLETVRMIKRAKITVNIIVTENSEIAQFEVFQRLNTGGLHLSDQEIRNCLMIMLDGDFFKSIDDFKKDKDFLSLIKLPDAKNDTEYRMELITRYLITIGNKIDYQKYKLSQIHVRDFIDSEVTRLIKDEDFDLNDELNHLKGVLSWVRKDLKLPVFNTLNKAKDAFSKSFSLSSFEVILPGLSANFDKIVDLEHDEIVETIFSIFKEDDYVSATKHGTKAVQRFQKLTDLSFRVFDGL